MRKKLILKTLPEGLVDIKALVHIFGKKRFKKIKQYTISKLPNGDLFLVLRDKRGDNVKPRQFPKIGRKKNASKAIKKILK